MWAIWLGLWQLMITGSLLSPDPTALFSLKSFKTCFDISSWFSGSRTQVQWSNCPSWLWNPLQLCRGRGLLATFMQVPTTHSCQRQEDGWVFMGFILGLKRVLCRNLKSSSCSSSCGSKGRHWIRRPMRWACGQSASWGVSNWQSSEWDTVSCTQVESQGEPTQPGSSAGL